MGHNATTAATGIPRKKPPAPEVWIAHYEAQDFNNKEASMKVIKELRALLYKTVVAGTKKKEKFMTDTVRKLDNVCTRLAVVETKLDTKPGFPEAMTIGVAIGTSATAVLGGLGGVWNFIQNATSTNNPNLP